VKLYATDKIRNICFTGQRNSGKTSLADAIAFTAGLNNRIGSVDNGTSLLDSTDSELSRKTTLTVKLLAVEWNDCKINILDCPGHLDFIGELMCGARVADSIGIIINAATGVEIGTQLQWKAISSFTPSRFFFVNKMEAEGVKWQKALDSIKESFGKQAVAVEIPIGEGTSFKGVVDLLHQKAFSFDEKGNRKEIEIPAELKESAQRERENLIEVAAEAEDSLLEKFFAEGTLSDAEVRKGLLIGIENGKVYPVLFGSATRNSGVRDLLDFISEDLPAPNEMPAEKAFKTGSENIVEVKPEVSGKTAALVFKNLSEGHLGDLSFLRVYSGDLKSGIDLKNQQTGSTERTSQTYSFQGKNRIDVPSLPAGDIGVLVKLKQTHTGNTLADSAFSVSFPPVTFPNPVMDVAIKPKTKGDEERIATGLHKLREEDPTFKLIADPALQQQVLYGQGSTHIDVIVEKLKKRFGVDVDLTKPKIPYRETVKGKTEIQYKHKKQSGGRGQYGDVYIRIEPKPRGTGFEFVDEIKGGVIPGKYLPAIEKGVVEAMLHGGLSGSQVVDVKVAVYYGSYHDVDSSDMAFKIAGLMAFKNGFLESKPVLLEPICNVAVTVPDEYTGDVMGHLSSKRAKIAGMDPDGRNQIIRATVPQAELYQYSVDLRSMTQGQGFYTLEFSHYEEVPHEQAQRIIDSYKAERAAANA
jgi:elongation factor G